MNKYADIVKNNLETLITELTENSHLYLKNPEKDFTRKRKLDFKEMIRLLLSMGGKSLNLELMEYFSYDVKTPTSSAFVQQRGKILPKAFETLFEKFTKSSLKPNKYRGYRLFAVDGSDLCIVFVKRKVYQFSIEKYTIILKKINGFLAIPQFL